MDPLASLAMAVLAAIHPAAPHTGDAGAVAASIAFAVEHDPHPAGWSTELTVAVMAEIAWRESRLRMGAVGPARCNAAGDCGAYCAFQVEHRPALARDPIGCARVALSILVGGAKRCEEHPLAEFAGGCFYAGTTRPNRAARRIGDERLEAAKRHLEEARRRTTY